VLTDWLLLGAVHTHGVNWESVTVIAGPILTLIGLIGKAVSGKLERVITQLESLNDKQSKQGERISNLEGSAKRTERAVTK
jgi:hypothetical protein